MNRPQILIIEDDNAIGNMISTTLETQHYQYRRAKNGASGVLAAASCRPRNSPASGVRPATRCAPCFPSPEWEPDMYSVKTNVLELTALMKLHGITRAVLSPGSRNSPINHTLASCPDILCTPVTDERSAAFTANGLCQALRRPVAACCTSGTALLDMAPAVAEAYYQNLPFIITSGRKSPCPSPMTQKASGTATGSSTRPWPSSPTTASVPSTSTFP